MNDERRNAIASGVELEGYRIEGVLGAGGFGVTYRATEILLNRHVAIKEYLPAGMAVRDSDGLSIAPLGATEAQDFAWGMERFRAEAQTLVSFRHPNIVSVHRYFETNNTGYLVMEYVEGRTLAQLLHPDKTLDEDEIHEILNPILDGLQAVHEKGFLHRDIKPANIFIQEDGSPVLIDFGAARLALGQQSHSLTAVISAGYAPYEQYDSAGDQGAWTDIYSLGGVLYRCATGSRPPDAPSRVSAIFAGRDDPLTPTAVAAGDKFSAKLCSTIDAALSVRETDRPQSVMALKEALYGNKPASGGGADISAANVVGAEAAGRAGETPDQDAGHSVDETLLAGPDRPAIQSAQGPAAKQPAAIAAEGASNEKQSHAVASKPAAPDAGPSGPRLPSKKPEVGGPAQRSRSPEAQKEKRTFRLRYVGAVSVFVAAAVGYWAYTEANPSCDAQVRHASDVLAGGDIKGAQSLVAAAYRDGCVHYTLDAVDSRIRARLSTEDPNSASARFKRFSARQIGRDEDGFCQHYVRNMLNLIARRQKRRYQQGLADAKAAGCRAGTLGALRQLIESEGS